jgi:eukaryotic-like serine/threonine-protein kinase
VTAPPPRPSPLAPGFKLDRYELLCPIAEGGMASVWIARQTGKHGFEKLVAVKTILPKFAADARFQKMFVDEARIASRIEHANVAQILDVGEQHETTYLVMEYVDGDSLATVNRSLQKEGIKMPPGVLLRLMAEVCGGLHAAHELRNPDGSLLGVVHRDVSPQNVLVSTRGITKLIDFGIAKARDRGAGDTNTETLKGKVRYMAPEQAHGHNVDRRADLWAVGAIMYHFLAGKPPYDGENDVQTLLLLTSGRPPPPLPTTVHRAIVDVVNRALSTVADKRYATAAEMQQAVQEAMIEAKASSSAAAVASFLGEHVAEPSRKRKEAITLGVKAAADREKYEEMMRSNVRVAGAISRTGVTETGASRATGALSSTTVEGTGRPRPRKRSIALVAVGGSVVGIGGLVLGLTLRSGTHAMATPVGAPPPTPAAPAVVAAAPPEVRTSPPTISAAELPVSAVAPPPVSAPLPPTPPPPVRTVPRYTPPPAPRPARARRVDDGF